MDNSLPEKFFDLDYYPEITEEDIKTDDYMIIPFTEMEGLGVAFASLAHAVGDAARSMDAGQLYEIAKMPKGTHLAKAKDNSGMLGMCFDNSNHLVGNATFKPVDSISKVASVPLDPSLIFVGAMLMRMEHKLDAIEETQREILAFLNRDKETKLEGDLKTLVDIINNCKYNWDNETFKGSNHMLAGDIKKEAQQNILFYRKYIVELLNKRKLLLTESDLKDKMKKLKSDFKYYQLSVYLYGFASFLEVLLSGNYKSDYINSVVSQLEELSFAYRHLYTDSYTKIERLSNKTAESMVLEGTAAVNKTVGKVMSKIPVVKKTPIDEMLMGAGKKLDRINDKSTAKKLSLLSDNRDSGVSVFIDNCKMLDLLYNQPKLVLVDEKAMYLKMV